MRDDPFVNPLCVGFCILWINGCILSLITASTIMLITGRNCYSSIVDGVVFASDAKRCTLSYFASVSSSETMDRWGWIHVSFKYQHYASTIRLNQSPDLRMQTCCYMYSLGIQCKRQNIPDHVFYSYSGLNPSLSYISLNAEGLHVATCLHAKIRTLIQTNSWKFVSDLWQVGGFLRVLRFPPPINLTTTI
jgi:hypothetical protein